MIIKVNDVVVGLDLGTNKVAVVIAELLPNGQLNVIGVGRSPSEGLRHGIVIDEEKAIRAIHRAVREAEVMAEVRVAAVYAGIAGIHTSSFNRWGMVAVSGTAGEISHHDKERVVGAAKYVSLEEGYQVLHAFPQEFFIDGQGGIGDPVGITGIRLEADVHLITCALTAVQSIRSSIVHAGYEVRGVMFEPLAASYAVLDEDERETGVCLIDIGGSTTNLALFSLGGINYTKVIDLGGQNVTSDLADGLGISWSQAEKIKCTWGTALADTVDKEEQMNLSRLRRGL